MIYKLIGKIAENNNGNKEHKQTGTNYTRVLQKIACELNHAVLT